VWELEDLAEAVASVPPRAPRANHRGPLPLQLAVRAALTV
jgi:hypothetical protein